MKICPKCNMKLDVHSECPLCHTDLTEAPYFKGEAEGYKLNKYFLIFLLKYAKFFIFCFIFCLIVFIVNLPILRWQYLLVLLLLVFCFLYTFYPKGVSVKASWKYTDDYLESTEKVSKYITGIFSIVFVLLARYM